jgi:hypothetical protein
MASLFALGVMSIGWMAFVAGLIALEKLLPWRRVATYGTAALLLALGVLVLVAPGSTPGLTIPTHGSMSQMNHMAQPSHMAPAGQGRPGRMGQPGQMGAMGS